MPNLTRAFLSYARKDQELAHPIRDALAHSGIEISGDVDDIPWGADWAGHMRAALDQADVVIAVMSPASIDSALVMTELGAAIGAGKPVIPITTKDTELPPAFRRWHQVRAADRTPDEIAREVREQLAHLSVPAA